MSTLLQDLRVGFRVLRKSPGFTAVAILTLALGIGCNGVVFSILNAVLLRPYPYENPSELVIVQQSNPQYNATGIRLSYPEFEDIRERAQAFEDMAAVSFGRYSISSSSSEPFQEKGARVSASVFSVVGSKMLAGRGFLPEEDRPGAPRVVVLSESLWRNKFAADPDIVGQSVEIEGYSHQIVGIIPASSQFPDVKDAKLLVPIAVDPASATRVGRSFLVIARLKQGFNMAQAESELEGIGNQLAEAYPDTNNNWKPYLATLRELRAGDDRPILLLGLFAVFLVLLIACVNVANLLLQRALAREQEMVVRAALGGSPRRLVRQLLTEGLLLALAGGAVGLLVAALLIRFFVTLMPPDRIAGYVGNFAIDGRVVVYLFLISLLTVMIFGLMPALRASRVNLRESLNESGSRAMTGGTHNRGLRTVLAISEIGLSLALLVSAGLMIQSFRKLQEVDPGFDSSNTLVFAVPLPDAKYPEMYQRVATYREIRQRLAAMPGVVEAGASDHVPVRDWGGNPIAVEGQTPEEIERNPIAGLHQASEGFFEAIQMPLRGGRLFSRQDNEDSLPVVIVNKALADWFWPDDDPIGQRLQLKIVGETWLEVVGVVGGAKSWGLGRRAPLDVYLPYQQHPELELFSNLYMFVRTSGDPFQLVASARSEVGQVDSTLPLDGINTMDQILERSLWEQRLNGTLFSVFAGFALLLAAVGIYGIMAYSVSQRRHEIGIRMVLGAQAGDVLKMMNRQILRVVLAGVVFGGLLAFVISKLMSSMFFGVEGTALVIFLVMALLMIGVAMIATFIPTRRATRLNPATALHVE